MARKRQKIEWLKAREVEKRFGFSRQALYHLRKAGKVESRRDGYTYLYSAASIEAYFQGRDEGKSKVPRPR